MKIVLIIIALFLTLGICSCTESVNQGNTSTNTMEVMDYNAVDVEENEDNSYQKDQEIVALLSEIKEKAAKGEVIDCQFKAKDNNIENVIESWGEADESSYVEDAKGQYYVYDKYGIVFGVNKGMQIFEVRTFNEKIKNITSREINQCYGEPDYEVTTELDETIEGYVINNDFKILLVFSKVSNEGDLLLDHYSILYPLGTANWMSKDGKPREW